MGRLERLNLPDDARAFSAQDFDAKEFIARHRKAGATPKRIKLLKEFAKKPWFQATCPRLQDALATLPQKGSQNHDGFLEALVERKNEIGGVRVIRLLKFVPGDFTLCPVFEVENIETGIVYSYDFAAFIQGVPAGAKGLVLVRPEPGSEPTHFILLSGEKFATSEHTYDLMGGLPEAGEGVDNVTDNIIREIQEETGVRNLKVDEVVVFGPTAVDPGHSSHKTMLFTAFLNADEASEIDAHAKNIDDLEMDTYVHMMPLSELLSVVKRTNNALVLAAVVKTVAQGLIPMKYCTAALANDNTTKSTAPTSKSKK